MIISDFVNDIPDILDPVVPPEIKSRIYQTKPKKCRYVSKNFTDTVCPEKSDIYQAAYCVYWLIFESTMEKCDVTDPSNGIDVEEINTDLKLLRGLKKALEPNTKDRYTINKLFELFNRERGVYWTSKFDFLAE